MTRTPHTSRIDLHVHSSASEQSKLGVQRALGLPECATPPEEVYELAKRRGMDFVTITDHDTIDGALAIADRPDAFISEELTVRFRGEAQAVHVLCWGIDGTDHEWLQGHADDVEQVAEYLHEQAIACALAHPFYAVEAPLTARHRRRLAELFPIWETRNGSRAAELNAPAAVYIETHGGIGVAGTDDHAGIDIGRTFTETPVAEDWRGLLGHVRAGRAQARGEQGSAAKWAHSAMALAVRSLGLKTGGEDDHGKAPDPSAVLEMVERLMREGAMRAGPDGGDLGPRDARALLHAWLNAVDLDLDAAGLLAMLQDETFSHMALYRRARRSHERTLARAVERTAAVAGEKVGLTQLGELATGLFDACVAAIPYAPATAFLGREKARLDGVREADPQRVALVADGVGAVHGVTRTLEELRERGVPGFEVDVVGTDHNVDRRLSAVADIEIPFYAGLRIGVPTLPAIVEALAEGRYDVVHVCSPGPAGIAAGLIARVMDVPVVGSYHTEIAAYAGIHSRDPRIERGVRLALATLYGQCQVVLSPSEASDGALRALGVAEPRIARWDRGVDTGRFRPGRRAAHPRDEAQRVTVLYAGRLNAEKGVDLLADAFLAARARDPRLHLLLAGGGPEEELLRARLGDAATFLGWLHGDALAEAYAAADVFLFASRTDTFGQVLLEAQASGLAIVAVDEGGPRSIVSDGVTGLLREPARDALADAVLRLAGDPGMRERLGAAATAAVAERSWERSLDLLAAGYRRALAAGTAGAAPARDAA